MADDFDPDSKTEAATQRRRDEAREQGQVAYSAELNTGIILMAGIGGLAMATSLFGSGLLTEVQLDLQGSGQREMTPEILQRLIGEMAGRGLGMAGGVLALIFIAAVMAGLGQVGIMPNFDLLSLNWDRVNPFNGGGKLFSWDKFLKGSVAIVKVVVVAALAYWVLKGEGKALERLAELRLEASVGQAWALVLRLGFALAGGLLLIGVTDYVLQRWRFEKSLRMSRQEIKDESRREDGDPLLKARIRKMQREAARKKMFHDLKTATAVVTNPTHLAIALRYDRGTMGAPRVVAKGAGFVAQRIREIAKSHGIPVLERKSLAQALFRSVKLDQEIPAGLYQAVAEVLAYVYRLRGGVES